jgi:hypothetical protein
VTEYTRVFVLVLGFALGCAGYVWLLSRAFRDGNWWGTLIFFLPPLALLYLVLHLRRSLAPIAVMLVGACVVFVPFGVKYFPRWFIDLGPRVKEVDGETHLTLTGWDRKDYAAILGAWPDAAVVQMANPDVTDETVKALTGFRKLKFLDLDNTEVTDEGLEVIARLPALEVLRLRNTKVTDAGFREHLAGMKSLRVVHYRGTGIQKTTLSDWKQRKDGRKFLP